MIPFSGLLGSKRQTSNTVAAGDLIYAPAAGGTSEFTVPDGLWNLSALAIGRSGNGLHLTDAQTNVNGVGGNGGDTRWANMIPVTPGEVLRLSIASVPTGNGATPAVATTITRLSSGEVLLSARSGRGGARSADSQSSTAIGTRSDGSVVGGGNGGIGSLGVQENGTSGALGGSGGAGGYSGNGGNGGENATNSQRTNGTGGAGAGGLGQGYGATGNANSQGGGGIGIYGEGASGTSSGQGGSGGASAANAAAQTGASYGGGAQAMRTDQAFTNGSAAGAIRLLWGQGPNNGGRAFPATNVATATS